MKIANELIDKVDDNLNSNVWCGDLEVDNKSQKVWYFYFEHVRWNLSHEFFDLKEVFKSGVFENFDRLQYFYFHNLNYDGHLLLNIWIENMEQMGYIYRPLQEIEYCKKWKTYKKQNPQTFTFLRGGSRSLFKIIYWNNKKVPITFICSYRKLLTSIAKLGKLLGFPKLKIDHYKNRSHYQSLNNVTEEEKKYCQRDVKVQKKAINVIFPLFQSLSKKSIHKSVSLSQFAFEIAWRSMNSRIRKLCDYTKIQDDAYEIHNWLKGGISGIKEEVKGKVVKGRIRVIDMTGMHNFQMATKKFSVDKVIWNCDCENNDLHLKFYHIKYKKVIFDNKVAPFLQNGRYGETKPKYVGSNKNGESFISSINSEIIFRHYKFDGLQVVKSFCTKWKIGIYKRFVEKVMERKDNAENEVIRHAWKTFGNCVFGKTIQHFLRQNTTLRTKEEIIEKGHRIFEHRYAGNNLYYDHDEVETRPKYTLHGINTLFYAGVDLISVMEYIPKCSHFENSGLLAWDTDSVIYNLCEDCEKIYFDELKKKNGIKFGNKNGEWKIEEIKGTHFIGLEPKKYFIVSNPNVKLGFLDEKKGEKKIAYNGIDLDNLDIFTFWEIAEGNYWHNNTAVSLYKGKPIFITRPKIRPKIYELKPKLLPILWKENYEINIWKIFTS